MINISNLNTLANALTSCIEHVPKEVNHDRIQKKFERNNYSNLVSMWQSQPLLISEIINFQFSHRGSFSQEICSGLFEKLSKCRPGSVTTNPALPCQPEKIMTTLKIWTHWSILSASVDWDRSVSCRIRRLVCKGSAFTISVSWRTEVFEQH